MNLSNKYAQPAGIIGLVAVLFVFVWSKLPVLNLPYFWDELGVYATGVLYMFDNGPGLLPANLDPEYSRGHPLLFYFIHSVAFRIFGPELITGHSVALVISVIFIIYFYFKIAKWINPLTALVAVALLLVQPLFYAQSVLVLPEILLAFLGFGAIASWINEKRWQYFIWCSLALLTKETAVVFPMVALGITIFHLLGNLRTNWKTLLSKALFSLSPFLVLLVFLVIQKFQHGWFFFPYHMDLMKIGIERIIVLSKGFGRFFFFLQGRWAYSLLIVIGIVLIYFSEARVINRRLFYGIFFTIIGGLLYSVLIFYMSRYTLFMLPFYILLVAYVINELAIKSKVFLFLIPVLLWISITNMKTDQFHVDTDMGYVTYVETFEEIMDEILLETKTGEKVFANFPFYSALKDSRLGYYKGGTGDSVLTGNIDYADIVIHAEYGPWLKEYESTIMNRNPNKTFKLMGSNVFLYRMD